MQTTLDEVLQRFSGLGKRKNQGALKASDVAAILDYSQAQLAKFGNDISGYSKRFAKLLLSRKLGRASPLEREALLRLLEKRYPTLASLWAFMREQGFNDSL